MKKIILAAIVAFVSFTPASAYVRRGSHYGHRLHHPYHYGWRAPCYGGCPHAPYWGY